MGGKCKEVEQVENNVEVPKVHTVGRIVDIPPGDCKEAAQDHHPQNAKPQVQVVEKAGVTLNLLRKSLRSRRSKSANAKSASADRGESCPAACEL